jgi:hypothetical protein
MAANVAPVEGCLVHPRNSRLGRAQGGEEPVPGAQPAVTRFRRVGYALDAP